ncbi:MAG: peptidoglycan DD-metalloendopeptidase family protein [Gemmatimonadales bacterium]|nr:peptidoglycan DD-metalloendopeptidase family protein [Gemmatimonadales bacterium]
MTAGTWARRLGAVGILGAALWAEAHDAWPWRRVAAPARPLALAAPRPVTETRDTLRRGEAPGALLARHGLRDLDLQRLLPALDPRRLRAGLVFRVARHADDSLPHDITVRTTAEERVRLVRSAGAWRAWREPVAWTPELLRVEARIATSLYDALDDAVADARLPRAERVRLAWALADVFAWQVDFSRDVQRGDRVRLLVERLVSDEGDVRAGRVLLGELAVAGRAFTAVRAEADSAAGTAAGWYEADGTSLRRAFLRAPVEFRRISSRVSRARLHPILGVLRRHEGTDYAADPGTPVLAAGDGVVLRAGWAGGLGRLVELRHAGGIITRYGHLSFVASRLRPGVRVAQGEPIGAVGSSGLSSGPHLHYEFRVHGVAKEPTADDLGTGEPVPAAVLPAFLRQRDALRQTLDQLPPESARTAG